MEFDEQKYKVYTWKNWMMLHWIINPGLAINELILGQRIPKISLLDKTSNKPKFERSFIPCPHCETVHDSRIWSPQNNTGYKNWFGLYCINCGNIIPCIINITSLLILTITYPLWGWFKNRLKSNRLENQPTRFTKVDVESTYNPFSKKSWLFTGLSWGLIMFLIMTFLFPYFGGTEMTLKNIFSSLLIWTIGGVAFGYTMKIYINS